MDKDQYENLAELVEDFEEQLLYAETEKRLAYMKQNPNYKTYSAEEVIGCSLSKVNYNPDNDGWE